MIFLFYIIFYLFNQTLGDTHIVSVGYSIKLATVLMHQNYYYEALDIFLFAYNIYLDLPDEFLNDVKVILLDFIIYNCFFSLLFFLSIFFFLPIFNFYFSGMFVRYYCLLMEIRPSRGSPKILLDFN
jgi:hypothetical protein